MHIVVASQPELVCYIWHTIYMSFGQHPIQIHLLNAIASTIVKGLDCGLHSILIICSAGFGGVSVILLTTVVILSEQYPIDCTADIL